MGTPQLRLIEAAVQCRVRRFAPAEFEGQPGLRAQNDILDRGRNAALALLQHYTGYIQYTVFVCGIFYERFAVNGMVSQRIGTGTGFGNEGDYIADVRNMTAIAPVWDAAQNLAYLQYQMELAHMAGNTAEHGRLSALLATAEGRYDFAVPAYLNSVYPDITTTPFRDWFLQNWASVP
ncbi:hypothetical protein N0V83_001537 [Neocucurbitaria cava]|uniref:Uncharacterized protein n=1 Tax=Neocucurbitaria cava TaxID=798079 RepID=A0A9W9CRB9_9PLEO|nr:hypothetical protein N0V83_001537 [Neocucurbitaria cava]